jgi:hypothetical protein
VTSNVNLNPMGHHVMTTGATIGLSDLLGKLRPAHVAHRLVRYRIGQARRRPKKHHSHREPRKNGRFVSRRR